MEPEASRNATPSPSDPRRNGSARKGHTRAPEPEAVLLERCRNGEPAGFEELFLRYKDYVYSTAFYLCRDEDGAADVTQEVFTKLLTRISQYRAGSRFTTWLYRIAYRACIDWARQRRRSQGVAGLPVHAEVAPDPSDTASSREVAELVQEAVRELRDTVREPLVLRYVAGLSYEEVADVTGLATGTVASRLNRAHRELAHRLRKLDTNPESGS